MDSSSPLVTQLVELEWLGSERLERWERFADWLALGHAAKVLVALRVGGRPGISIAIPPLEGPPRVRLSRGGTSPILAPGYLARR